LRDNTKDLEHLFEGNLNEIFFMFPSSVGEKKILVEQNKV
jgi:hypothetical protein